MTRRNLILATLSVLLLLAAIGCKKSKGGAMEHIERERALTIATHPVNEPLEFGKGTGVQGFDVDIGEEIASALKVKSRWIKTGSFPNLFQVLQSGDADLVISSVSITPDREKNFAFSDPYYVSGQTVVVTSDNKDIKSLENLKGKKVGVQGQTTGQAFLMKSNLPGVQVTPHLTLEDALQAVSAREIDAVVGDYPIVAYLIYKRYPHLKTVGDRLNEEKYGIMLRKDDKDLLEIANQTLKKLHETGKYDQLVKNWFGEFEMNREAARRKAQEQERAGREPKGVVFKIHKSPGYREFEMSRLDGFQITLQGRDSGRVYTSSPILTDGSSGSCQTNALPGHYTLNLKRIGLSAEVEVPPSMAKNVIFIINISKGGVSIQRT